MGYPSNPIPRVRIVSPGSSNDSWGPLGASTRPHFENEVGMKIFSIDGGRMLDQLTKYRRNMVERFGFSFVGGTNQKPKEEAPHESKIKEPQTQYSLSSPNQTLEASRANKDKEETKE